MGTRRGSVVKNNEEETVKEETTNEVTELRKEVAELKGLLQGLAKNGAERPTKDRPLLREIEAIEAELATLDETNENDASRIEVLQSRRNYFEGKLST